MRDLQGRPSDRIRSSVRRIALTAVRRRPRRCREGVRVVHYHYVFDDQRAQFTRQIDLLATQLEPVSLTEAVRRLRDGDVSGAEVVVTFDDGFRNQLTNAAPVLADHDVPACFYLISELVGASPERTEEICRDRILMQRPLEPLDWGEARELIRLGHELGSHTRTHPKLATLDAAGLNDELAGSKAELEQRLGTEIVHASAPFGGVQHIGSAAPAAARAAGYESFATARRGVNRNPEDVFELRRHHLVADWPLDDVKYFLDI
jgi:peptidoglycan/xylan/chitin deacetylase (PgdA/CDA1 family)